MTKTCVAARNRRKIHKPLVWRSRSFKVIEFGANRKPMYDFLLVINNNLSPISHRYWDTATYLPKIAKFAHPLSFSALVRGSPLRVYGKALRLLKLESSRQPTVKIWWSYLAPFLTDPPVWETDGQTDGRTELRWLRRAESSRCFRA